MKFFKQFEKMLVARLPHCQKKVPARGNLTPSVRQLPDSEAEYSSGKVHTLRCLLLRQITHSIIQKRSDRKRTGKGKMSGDIL